MAADKPLYRLRPRAEDDLERIWLFTRERWSIEQADDYVRMIVDAFAGLGSGAKQGRTTDVREGYFKYVVGSHVIYYVRKRSAIEIVRILHGRMDVSRQL